MIQMEFSEAEYRLLLEMTYLADWMANAHKVPDEENLRYRDLEQKLMAQGKKVCGDMVDVDEEEKLYYPSKDLEEGVCCDIIEEYDDETFWEELPDRLAVRDVEQEKGEGALEKMTPEERVKILGEKEDEYIDEIETHGLSRFVITDKPS